MDVVSPTQDSGGMGDGRHVTYDVELASHDAVLHRALRLRPTDRVVDVGCGTGTTTRRAAREASAGRALGVDVSPAAVGRARELAAAEGLANAEFEVGDAAVHPFPDAAADVVMSRFGTMFFTDPAAGFANLARALRRGGRLVMLVWQGADRQEWDVALREAAGAAPSGLPDAFSLGDPATLRTVLHAAGLVDVDLADVRAPVHYGPDVDAALGWVRGFAATRAALPRLDDDGRTRALARLVATLEAHRHDDGVRFDSRSWLVTARRPDA